MFGLTLVGYGGHSYAIWIRFDGRLTLYIERGKNLKCYLHFVNQGWMRSYCLMGEKRDVNRNLKSLVIILHYYIYMCFTDIKYEKKKKNNIWLHLIMIISLASFSPEAFVSRGQPRPSSKNSLHGLSSLGLRVLSNLGLRVLSSLGSASSLTSASASSLASAPRPL